MLFDHSQLKLFFGEFLFVDQAEKVHQLVKFVHAVVGSYEVILDFNHLFLLVYLVVQLFDVFFVVI